MNEKIEAKLKEFDAYLDSVSKTPEKAEIAKREIRENLNSVKLDAFKLISLDVALNVAKKMKA